jgi:hypothetical protein
MLRPSYIDERVLLAGLSLGKDSACIGLGDVFLRDGIDTVPRPAERLAMTTKPKRSRGPIVALGIPRD